MIQDDNPTSTPKQKLAAVTVLETARYETCYGTLRSLIGVLTLLSYIFSISFVAIGYILF